MEKPNLEEFKKYLLELEEGKEITKDTASSYYSCMKVLRDHCELMDEDKIKKFLIRHLKNRKQLNKYISAIKKYEQGVLKRGKRILDDDALSELIKVFKEKGYGEPYAGEKVSYDTALRKSNAIRDEKLKITMRLQLKSGLRVSEIAALRKRDLRLEDGKITLYVIQGKGRKDREVHVIDDPYLYRNLVEYLKDYTEDELIFLRKDTIKHQYVRYGVPSHDLRRLNAKERLRVEVSKGKSKRSAKKAVQEEFGHASMKTTDIYLHSALKKKEGD